MTPRRAAANVLCLVSLATAAGCGNGHEAPPPSTTENRLVVHVDRRVELMSIVFRLAGLPRYTEAATPYARAVDAHFAPYREHDAVVFSRQLGARSKIGYEMAPLLAVFLDDKLEPLVPLDPLPAELARWKVANLKIYLAAIRDFAKTADLDGFLAQERGDTEGAVASDRAFFDKVPAIDWLDRTFGKRPNTDYHLVPGMLAGPMDYASRVTHDGKEHVYVIAHLDVPDEAGVPRPRELAIPFVIHELCHSYTNPIVDASLAELQPLATGSIAAGRELFQGQAYTTDAIVLEESVVRALVVLWVRDRNGTAAADAEIAQQEGLGFTWARKLADALDASRKQAPLDAAAIISATRAAFAP